MRRSQRWTLDQLDERRHTTRETLTLAAVALIALLALLVYGCVSAVSPTPIHRIGGALAPADQQEIPQ